MNITWVIVGTLIGLIVGGGVLYVALSNEILSADILPPVKKLKEQTELQQNELNSLKDKNDKMKKYSVKLKDYAEKIKSNLNTVIKQKDSLQQYSQNLLDEKNTIEIELSKSQLEATEYKTRSASLEKQTNEITDKLNQETKQNAILEKQTNEITDKLNQQTENSANLEKSLEDYSNKVKDWQQKIEENIKIQACKPTNQNIDQIINWSFCDSKGNQYTWQIPVTSFEHMLSLQKPENYFTLELSNGEIIQARDHTEFVGKSFKNVIDDVYDNAGSEDQFIFEVWRIVSQLDTYSTDIGENPRWALETLSRGGGDCEDTAILIADMIRSSKHTENWQVQLFYLDAYNPSEPKTVNHVIVTIDTGNNHYNIESTAKTPESAYMWADKVISGWGFDV